MKNFIQDGKTIEYKVAETAIKSGDVRVIGDVAGVALLTAPWTKPSC